MKSQNLLVQTNIVFVTITDSKIKS